VARSRLGAGAELRVDPDRRAWHQAQAAPGRRVLFVSGDDGAAKSEVAELFETAGFTPIDLGGLATGGRLQARGGPFAGRNLVQLP
jgi:predicted dinucleotide-binding enzyme